MGRKPDPNVWREPVSHSANLKLILPILRMLTFFTTLRSLIILMRMRTLALSLDEK